VPLALKRIAKKHHSNALIALGAVIKGETDHYHNVNHQVSNGIAKLTLELDTPIIFGILTTHTKEQALARVKQATNYAENAVEMANLLRNF
jgi:6,7-dimethyl-8-ribityllumazine synthase